MAKSSFNPADYEAVQAVVERALPKLDFHRNPDHALVGDELLALLNRWGARLEAQKHTTITERKETNDDLSRIR